MSERLRRWRVLIITLVVLLGGIFGDGGPVGVHNGIAQDIAQRRNVLDKGGEPKLSPELRALDALHQFRTQQEGRVANVSIEEPVDITGFPSVRAFVLVTDSLGKAVEGLQSLSFTVREQRIGEAKRVPEDLRVSELSLEVTKADIVFVVDQSGSMGDEIATVRDRIQKFADLLLDSQIDFRLGGVSYEGEGWGGIGVGRSTGGFLTDIEEFKRWARGIPAAEGIERGYDAIVTVTQPPFIYRPDAQQIICLVTDEGNDLGANDITQAYNTIGEREFFYFNTQLLEPEYIEETDRDYGQLGTKLGGIFDEHALLELLGGMITRKYVIEYTSPWPEKDCIPRELTVTVADLSDKELVAQDAKHYAPGSQGIIFGAISDQVTGDLLQGVSVALLQGENIVSQILTNEQSNYSFEGLCKGGYAVRATRVGYKTERKEIALEADGRLVVDFELVPSTGKEEKEVLIAQLKKVKQYVEEEQRAEQYLDELDLSSPKKLEALRRLILAENLVNEAYTNAEQRAEIAGLAVGTTLVFLVDDILITKAIKEAVDRLLPEKITFRFFGKEIGQTSIFVSVKEKIFGMIDVTIIEVTNRIVVYTIQVFPDTVSALKNEVARIFVKALTGLILEELSVQEIVGNQIKKPLLDWYGELTDEAIEQSVDSAEADIFIGTYQDVEQAVASHVVLIIQGTDGIRSNVKSGLASAELAASVQSITDSVANISAAFSASGVMGVVSAIARLIEVGSITIKYGFSGYVAGTSIYSLLLDLPRQVAAGTAAGFGRGAWPAPQIPYGNPLLAGTQLSQESSNLMAVDSAAPVAMAQTDFSDQLDWLIDLIESDDLAKALEFTNDSLLPANEAFRKARNASEARVLAVGGNAFPTTPLFELRYKKLAALSPDTSLQTVSFFTNLLAFFWQASNVTSPQNEDYLRTKTDIIIEARSLRDKVQRLSDELNAANTLVQGFRITPTVIIDDVEITSDEHPTTTITESPQDFTVTATLKNLGSSGIRDATARLILSEDSTLTVTGDEFVRLSYLPGEESAKVEWELRHVGPTTDVRNAVILSIEPIDPEFLDFNMFPPTVILIASAPASLSPPTGGQLSNKNIYAYPNPFNPDVGVVNIRYSLNKNANVTIEIYDVSGELVTTLIKDQPKEKELEYSESWDGRNDQGDIVANGVYFYLITTTKAEKAVGKIAVLR